MLDFFFLGVGGGGRSPFASWVRSCVAPWVGGKVREVRPPEPACLLVKSVMEVDEKVNHQLGCFALNFFTRCGTLGALSSFILVTRVRFLTSKFNIEPNGGIFDVSPKSDRTSPNVKTPTLVSAPVWGVGRTGCVTQVGTASQAHCIFPFGFVRRWENCYIQTSKDLQTRVCTYCIVSCMWRTLLPHNCTSKEEVRLTHGNEFIVSIRHWDQKNRPSCT